MIATDGQGNSDTATIYFEGANGLPEPPVKKIPLVTNLTSSNPANPAYYMEMPAQPQWPIYYDFDSTADNSLDILPPELEGATWIALRRVTKPGQNTEVGFSLSRPATVYVISTRQSAPPGDLISNGFQPRPAPGLAWRDNTLHLVPAELYARRVPGGRPIQLKLGDRDAMILLKPE